MKKILAAAVAMGLVGLTQGAGTATGTLEVTATVASACTVDSATNFLNFGTFNPTGSAVTATTDISITCANGVVYTVGLDNGLHSNLSTRRMLGALPTQFLEYSINRPIDGVANTDSGFNWGNTFGVDRVARTGSGVGVNATAYGTIPANPANAAAAFGSYSDTVGITVYF